MKRRTITNDEIAEIHRLAGLGFNQRDAAKRVGVSLGTVNNILSEPAPAPKKAKKKPKPAPEPAPTAEIDLSPEACVQRAAEHLEHAAREARTSGDTQHLIAASRAATAVAVAASKLPKPAPTTDERAEMIAAAKRAREKLHDLFDRLLAEAPE